MSHATEHRGSRAPRFQGLVESIGGTPVVEIARLSPNPAVRLFAKLEAANPTGSVKDRVVRALVEDLESSGRLDPDSILLEATSGNTGIALAMIGRRKGYRVAVVMPDNVTAERRALVALHGAEIIDSPGALGSNGAIALARDLVQRDPRFVMADQYANPANPRAHEETTGPEALRQFRARRVRGRVGTGGTLTGVGRFMHAPKRNVQIVAAEPPGESVRAALARRWVRARDLRPHLLDDRYVVSNREAVATAQLLDARSSPGRRRRGPVAARSPRRWTACCAPARRWLGTSPQEPTIARSTTSRTRWRRGGWW